MARGDLLVELAASTVTRLCEAWRAEHRRWQTRDLSDVDYVYIWADGVYPNVRLPDRDGNRDELCLLVIVGVRADGTKEVVAVVDGYRESTDSWADVLRDLKDRGMRAPELAVGDGALGLWAALRTVWPSTRQQLCWVHKTARVLSALPKRLHPRAKQLIHGISYAELRTEAVEAAQAGARDPRVADRWSTNGRCAAQIDARAQPVGATNSVNFSEGVIHSRVSRGRPLSSSAISSSRSWSMSEKSSL